MTRIDLDDLERKARAATGGEWAADRVAGMPRDDEPVLATVICLDLGDDGKQQQIADCYDNTRCTDKECENNATHIAANSPPVTLALTERIRRLEGLLEDVADALGADGNWPITEQQIRELLAKGAVLP